MTAPRMPQPAARKRCRRGCPFRRTHRRAGAKDDNLLNRYYYEIMALADGKPVALGEVGTPPSADVLKAQPKWAFFMHWAGMVNDRIKPAYTNPSLIHRGDPIPAN